LKWQFLSELFLLLMHMCGAAADWNGTKNGS
jgi:hypothetical protein